MGWVLSGLSLGQGFRFLAKGFQGVCVFGPETTLEPRAVFAGTDDRKGKGRSYK